MVVPWGTRRYACKLAGAALEKTQQPTGENISPLGGELVTVVALVPLYLDSKLERMLSQIFEDLVRLFKLSRGVAADRTCVSASSNGNTRQPLLCDHVAAGGEPDGA